MSHDRSRRPSVVPFGAPDHIPNAPPLPAPKPLHRVRDAANKLFGYYTRPSSPQEEEQQIRRGSRARFASLSATENATASHKTGLEIRTIAINEEGTHALLGGKEIFKTIKVEDGSCAEELNLRSAIRSTDKEASGKTRQIYSIDIADVAWAKGDCGHFVAAATSSGKIILYDLGHAGLPAAQLHEHFRQVHKVTFNPHRGSLLLSGSQDGTVRLWDVRDVRSASMLKSKHKYNGQSDGVRDVKWSPTDGVDFAFGTDSGWVQSWDMRNLKTAKIKVPAHINTCNAIDWHPDGKHIGSAGADKAVRVWDFSASRPKKASWEIKTPYSVLNARWRPSCELSVSIGNGARQCTQLVTAYDELHPVLHLWDFRRPAFPFREVAPYSTAPTDLLWHSQDLLWTVGREGVFLQSDVQHAAKIMDKRNLQSVALSPLGDINFVTLKRPQRPFSKHQTSLSKSSPIHKTPQNNLSRSLQDDSLDNSFLSIVQPKKKEAEQGRAKTRTQSLNMGSSSEQHRIAVSTMALDEMLLFRNSERPIQITVRGSLRDIPVHHKAYMARKIATGLQGVYASDDFIGAFKALIEDNASIIHALGWYKLAQSWRIIGAITVHHLNYRAEYRREALSVGRPQIQTPAGSGDLSKVVRRILGEEDKSPSPTPPSLKPVSTIARQLALSDETSSQPTPLARPVSKLERTILPDPDVAEHLTLPPSLSPTSEEDNQEPFSHFGPKAPRKFPHSPNGIGRADMAKRWGSQASFNLDPTGFEIPPRLEKRDSDESFAFLEGSVDSRDPSIPSSHASNGSGPLGMVSERPSRTNLGKSMERISTAAVDFGTGPPDQSKMTLFDDQNLSARPERSHYLTAGLSGRKKEKTAITATNDETTDDNLVPGSYPDEWGILPPAEQKPPRSQPSRTQAPKIRSRERQPPQIQLQDVTDQPAIKIMDRENRLSDVSKSASERTVQEYNSNTWLYLPQDGDPDLEEGKPLVLIDMMRELLKYYTRRGNAQTVAQLILLLSPLLPRTHPLLQEETHAVVSQYVEHFTSTGYSQKEIEDIMDQYMEPLIVAGLNPLQNEAILSTYHEQLMKWRCFNEAAMLRQLCYPTYPAVYEDFLADNKVHLRCGSCKKPLSPGTSGKRCGRCKRQPVNCPVCWMKESPYELADDMGSKGSGLWTFCLLCNHGGHAACMQEWLLGCDDGGCPSQGCLCDCTPGVWREQKAG